MIQSLVRYDASCELPDAWDSLATTAFQKRGFLAHCERFNPCSQRYHVLLRDGQCVAGAIVYTLRLDLLTFAGIKSPARAHIVGVPCSVATSGLIGAPGTQAELMRRLICAERGFVLLLNLPERPSLASVAVGRTWPDLVLDNVYRSWPAYVASLRSEYRRRLGRVERDAGRVAIHTTSCNRYDQGLHELYENVFRRSEGKLEHLSCAFFQHLPEPFKLTTFSTGGTTRGWVITLHQDDHFWFFLGGQHYDADARQFYLVKVMTAVRMGIENGARQIHLGQSAEIPKLRMGALPSELYMAAHHQSALVRAILGGASSLLSYRKRFVVPHVFRTEVS